MHSSRMRTARLLPVYPSMHRGGVFSGGGVCSQCTMTKVPYSKREGVEFYCFKSYPHPLNLKGRGPITSLVPLTLEPPEHDHHLPFHKRDEIDNLGIRGFTTLLVRIKQCELILSSLPAKMCQSHSFHSETTLS